MAEIKREGFAEEGAEVTYERLVNVRQPYETRAEACAAVTIPSLYPKDSDNETTDYKTPYQSIGARGVNNLASKLMLALFPMQTWLKLSPSEFEVKSISGDKEAMATIDSGLAMVERILMNYMESNSYRVDLFEAIKQLIIAGNALLYIPNPDDNKISNYNPMKLYKLSSYVVQRDTFGNILQIVMLDKVAYSALDVDIQDKIPDKDNMEPDSEVSVYTHVYLDPETKKYLKYEEIDGEIIEGTDAEYPLEANPYIPIRMVRLSGESYGRSYAEEYLGDLRTLENLSENIVKYSAIASKVIGLVNPAGITTPRRLVKAQTGDYVTGRRQDIEFLQIDKMMDLSIAKNTADDIEARLGFAFMLNSAVQRTGERVTAEEIRYVAAELEDTLGGVYSILSQELQLPLVKVLLVQLQAVEKIPEMPKEAVNPTVTTGLDALGRGQDKDKLIEYVEGLGGIRGLEGDPDIKLATLKKRLANAIGIDASDLLLTEEDKQQALSEAASQQATLAGAQAGGQGLGAAATASPEAIQGAMAQAGMPTTI